MPNYKTKYENEVRPALKEKRSFSSIMQVPRIEKIVINQGLGDSLNDKKIIEKGIEELSAITGQLAVSTKSKRDISNFKLRKGRDIGVRVTLRGKIMYEFLERLVSSAIPRIKDFNGLNTKLDGHGNYTIGIQEQIIFPEIEIEKVHKMTGMNITIVTNSDSDEEAFALLQEFGFPFKKN
ncbi:MAG: 50S ribosomal protein L5 [Bacteroidales bacterium]|nr:50S ribosomal protein L5 [Bacteroidales bacterium]